MKLKPWILCLAALLVLSFLTSPAHAMILKKTWILQGTAGFSTSSGDLYGDETRTTFSLSPTVHYTIMDKFGIGGTLDYTNTSHGDASSSGLAIGPSVRYYFGKEVDKRVGTINPYLGGGIFLQSNSYDDGNPNTNEEDQSGSTIQLLGGVAIFLSNTVAITPELSINLESLEDESGTTIMLGIGITGFLHQ